MNAAYMQRCLDLAKNGLGHTLSNPLVGAVIVADEQIIGEGWHQYYGGPHAEVNAIQQVLDTYPDAAKRLQSATLYVNLEPCAHQGKTPPCSSLIIRHKIPKVVIGCTDTFAKVSGAGIRQLREKGIEVSLDVMQKECRELNKRFFTFQEQQRPYVILKWAESADGYFAPADGSKKRISGPESEQLVHRWRSEEAAILVGKNTALADDPRLNTRLWPGKNPVRLLIDKHLETPSSFQLFNGESKTIIINTERTKIEGPNTFLQLDFDAYLPHNILYNCYLQDLNSLIVEGGAITLQTFIDAGLWDEARVFSSVDEWKAGKKAPEFSGILLSEDKVGKDTLRLWKNEQFGQSREK